MTITRIAIGLFLFVTPCFSQVISGQTPGTSSSSQFALKLAEPTVDPNIRDSSTTSLPEAPASAATLEAPAPAPPAPAPDAEETNTNAFSGLAVAVKVGLAGIGFDVATPLARKFNLRGGASFISYNSASYLIDGMTVDGGLTFRTAGASVDYFPFGHSSFHISPGIIFYNGDHLTTNVSVATGNNFSLNSVEYTSGSTPIAGTLDVTLGNKVAPSVTIGSGDMLRRKGGHFSIPVEVGFAYISAPKLTLNLNGIACRDAVCTSVGPGSPSYGNEQGEQTDLQNEISDLRLFPILSVGFGYKF